MNYLQKLKFNCPELVICDDLDMAVPHQSISPREILANWVKNDADTSVHERVDDWRGGDVHPNSIREFEDNFEALEYLADVSSSPVTLDNLGNPTESTPAVTPPVDSSSPPVDSSSPPADSSSV